MHRRKRLIFFTVIIMTIVVLFAFLICSSQSVKLVCYDKREKALFIYGDTSPFLENVVAPAWTEKFILAIFDDGEEAFIGKYVLEEGEWEVLLPVSQFQEKTGQMVEISLFNNFRIAHNGDVAFIYDNSIYSYNPSTKEIDILKDCDNILRFEWLDDNTLVTLDELGDLLIGWLKKYNIQTKEELVIDKSVTDFVCLTEDNQVVYAKKYFMGSWCEYELKYLDAKDLKIVKNKRYFNTSIGQIVVDSENNVFVVESRLSPNNKLEVKRIRKRTLSAISVMKVDGYCIGIK